jgi:glycosyltransferase involved in cell wall biosynthesis
VTCNNAPLVTVLTPVYNGADFLAECIESVLKQTYENYEYSIVNNCSTDRTLEIARQFAARDPRIRVHSNERFLGVIANHNRAFNLMSPGTRYVKVVSGDDFLFPDCIERMVEFAEAHPSVGIIGAYQLSGSIIKWQGFQYPTAVFPGHDIGRRCLLRSQVFVEGEPVFGFGTPTSLMYRADLVRETKEFYPNPSPHSDNSACFSCLRHSDFGFVYQVLSYERTHGETQSSASKQMNRYSSVFLDDLLQYGSYYLSPDELKRELNETLKGYRRFLAKNYLLRSKDKDFWEYHEGRLKQLGYPLSRFDLLKTAMGAVVPFGLKSILTRLASLESRSA